MNTGLRPGTLQISKKRMWILLEETHEEQWKFILDILEIDARGWRNYIDYSDYQIEKRNDVVVKICEN
jgi:hypothetical protein